MFCQHSAGTLPAATAENFSSLTLKRARGALVEFHPALSSNSKFARSVVPLKYDARVYYSRTNARHHAGLRPNNILP